MPRPGITFEDRQESRPGQRIISAAQSATNLQRQNLAANPRSRFFAQGRVELAERFLHLVVGEKLQASIVRLGLWSFDGDDVGRRKSPDCSISRSHPELVTRAVVDCPRDGDSAGKIPASEDDPVLTRRGSDRLQESHRPCDHRHQASEDCPMTWNSMLEDGNSHEDPSE
jgi:hypothetical protein